MDIELNIQLVPTDKGVVLLARSNDRYKHMVSTLNVVFEGEYSYVIPYADRREILISTEQVDLSILGEEGIDRGVSYLYEYPYSERELNRWCDSAQHKFTEMKETYGLVQKRMESEFAEKLKGSAEVLEEVIVT